MSYKEHRSPNFDDRPQGVRVDTLVIHYTGMERAVDALDRMSDPESKVSCHYLVHRDGQIYTMVPEAKRAWHAGKGSWRGRTHLNDCSIGIELDNPGHEWGYVEFTEPQMAALEELAQELTKRYFIEPQNVIAHSDLAPDRKEDPGELFEWRRLARKGVGYFPTLPADVGEDVLFKAGATGAGVISVQKRLSTYGYEVAIDGEFGPKTELVVKAFESHYGPRGKAPKGDWDEYLDLMLSSLINMCD